MHLICQAGETMVHGVILSTPAGTPWQHHAIKAAKATLQLRYGLLTEAQMQNALQRAMHNSNNKYEKNMVYDD